MSLTTEGTAPETDQVLIDVWRLAEIVEAQVA